MGMTSVGCYREQSWAPTMEKSATVDTENPQPTPEIATRRSQEPTATYIIVTTDNQQLALHNRHQTTNNKQLQHPTTKNDTRQ
jgi:hypothetical protein